MEEKLKTEEVINGWKVINTYPNITIKEREEIHNEIIQKLHNIFSK